MLTEIDSLLPHFVKKEIINFKEERLILTERIAENKVKGLLSYISGPLESGNSDGFYELLLIMKSEGKPPTVKLANDMEKSLESAVANYNN